MLILISPAESWVTKAGSFKKLDMKGRGRMGIKVHKHSRLHMVLKEGKTYEEKVKEARAKVLSKVRSAGVVREDRPLINVAPVWAW
jgi:large subunit ribosomal protein L22